MAGATAMPKESQFLRAEVNYIAFKYEIKWSFVDLSFSAEKLTETSTSCHSVGATSERMATYMRLRKGQ